jgi:tRNA 5-methylaminomethyl-2-thiouridine biosynthesis bifunctional protein
MLTPNLHRLSFEGGRIELLLALGDVTAWLPELVAQVDAFYLDGFAPAKNPQMWQPRLFKALARVAAPGATAATWTAARGVREGLTTAGFEVRLAPGRGGKRDITLATYAPAFTPRRAPRLVSVPTPATRHALIVGAGLAGCATSLALAEQGWTSTLIDRRDAPAQETSGNPGGLFHGIVNPQDGAHARFNRAAALHAAQAIAGALLETGVAGAVQGLLRLETSGLDAAAMQASIAAQGLPAAYVQAVDALAASALSGVALQHPAWYYPQGGWVQPAALAASWLARAAPSARFIGQTTIGSLRRAGTQWQVIDDQGAVVAEAEVVVLANAGDALRLLGQPAWPVDKVRGQISLLPGAAFDVPMPKIPLAGSGYLLPALNGQVIFGASSQAHDDDPTVRLSDHAHNLAQLNRLIGSTIAPPLESLQGRTAWRWVSDDRLPIVGAVPDSAAATPDKRLDQVRLVPRLPGLFVYTALGSRGITWSTLGARVLAAAISGAPAPLEASLLAAIDPARFIAREARRQAGTQAVAPSQPRSST